MLIRPLSNVLWNLFLAVIPVVLSFIIFFGMRKQQRSGRLQWALWVPLLMVWLAFLPNTCYLLTEWRHYLDGLMRSPDLYWQSKHNTFLFVTFLASSVFYLCYSGTGLLCFFLSIYPIDLLFNPPWYIRPFFFFLCALGVYLGLIDRFNSWQILRHPHQILHAAHQAVQRPFLLFLMCGFSLVLWLCYGIFSLTMEGAKVRYRQLKSTLAT